MLRFKTLAIGLATVLVFFGSAAPASAQTVPVTCMALLGASGSLRESRPTATRQRQGPSRSEFWSVDDGPTRRPLHNRDPTSCAEALSTPEGRARRGRSAAESVDGDEHSSILKHAMAGHGTGFLPTPPEPTRSCIARDSVAFR